jgi:hypothetical protein
MIDENGYQWELYLPPSLAIKAISKLIIDSQIEIMTMVKDSQIEILNIIIDKNKKKEIMEKETIQFAAIRRTDNCIVYGKDHKECIDKSSIEDCQKGSEQGFITNTFRFVGRKEAALIAFKAGQIDNYKDDQILLSEELWDRKSCGQYDYNSVIGYVRRNTIKK